MTNGANSSYVNGCFAADVLYMRANSHVICKIDFEVFCSSRVSLNFLCIYLDV